MWTTGKSVLTGDLTASGQVHSWGSRIFWTVDFSAWQKAGHYALQVHTASGEISSCAFEINNDVLERNTLSNVVFYFKGQRASGLMDKVDRHLPRMGDGTLRTTFFFPHDTEAAPWWQGENARLASLAAAARMALPLFADDPGFQSELRTYAWNQLHWILGRNPFDTSMLMGSGHGNAAYMFFRSYKYTNAPGSIINGITAGLDDEDGIAFNEGFAVTGKDEDWRWTEQWLPHAAWYLYAISLPHD